MSYKIKTKIDGNSYIKTVDGSFKVFHDQGGASMPTPTPTEEEMYLCVYTFATTPTPTPTEEESYLCVYTFATTPTPTPTEEESYLCVYTLENA